MNNIQPHLAKRTTRLYYDKPLKHFYGNKAVWFENYMRLTNKLCEKCDPYSNQCPRCKDYDLQHRKVT
jgi:hypothetical protein